MKLRENLSALTGKIIPVNLEKPEISIDLKSDLGMPQLELFTLQKEQIEASEALVSKKNLPKVMGFATGGYGNPGLNMLDNSFQTFYMSGIRMNYPDGSASG